MYGLSDGTLVYFAELSVGPWASDGAGGSTRPAGDGRSSRPRKSLASTGLIR